jgi:hypothetical protein
MWGGAPAPACPGMHAGLSPTFYPVKIVALPLYPARLTFGSGIARRPALRLGMLSSSPTS